MGERLARVSAIDERRFYSGMAVWFIVTVIAGFGRTYFFAPWLPQFQHLAAPESYFFRFHGIAMSAWMLLFLLQTRLIAHRTPLRHRRMGGFGIVLAALVVVTAAYGLALAGSRPGGFVGVSMPPLAFMFVPMMDLILFSGFVGVAVAMRRDPQTHKRLMLLSMLCVIPAALIREPIPGMQDPMLATPYSVADAVLVFYWLALIGWNLYARKRPHLVSLLGGLAIALSMPLRYAIAESDAWLGVAKWMVKQL